MLIFSCVDELCLMPADFLQLIAFSKHFVEVSSWLGFDVLVDVSIEAYCL